MPLFLRVVLLAAALAAATSAAKAQAPSLDGLVSAVVGIKTTLINPDARTAGNLGTERIGSGIVIDDKGLILTIGYLIVEADGAEVTMRDGRTVPASIVGYDHETGFGLLRTIVPITARPMPLGASAQLKKGDPLLVASTGGTAMILPVHVAAVREFAGSWEYLLDKAIFTQPPHPAWSGAALISRDGKLVGVGSLIIGDPAGEGADVTGNMFVPIDGLPPILGDLVAHGRVTKPARPWLGLGAQDSEAGLRVNRVTAGGPAEKAGVRKGDLIVGVAGVAPKNLADFYRKVWARGSAGATVPLDVLQDDRRRRIEVPSMNRLDHLRLKATY
ncbi:MAG: S1C family serine protease [Xanthobacteraceae bacterium]